MRPPPIARAPRAFTDMRAIESELAVALRVIRADMAPEDGSAEDDALAIVESFCAVALRVMKKTNRSRIKDAAMVEEIKARIDGRPVIE